MPGVGGNDGRLNGEAPFRENGCCGGCLGSIAPKYLTVAVAQNNREAEGTRVACFDLEVMFQDGDGSGSKV